MAQTSVVTKLEIQTKNDTHLGVFFNGFLIASSTMETGCPLSTLDIIAANLDDMMPNAITMELEKKQSTENGYDDSEEGCFSVEALQEALLDYCNDHIEHFNGFPMDFEYCGVMFKLEEFKLILTNWQYRNLKNKINHF